MHRHRDFRFWTVAAVLVISISSEAMARTWNVLPDGSGDAPTIQAAVDSCSGGDVVVLASGVFQGEGNRDIGLLGKAITIRGATGNAEDCVIDCQGTDTEHHRGFLIQSAEGPDTRLEAFTVTGGYVDSPSPIPDYCGGGILVQEDCSPTMANLTLRENYAPAGGGMFAIHSSLNLAGCRFLDNEAPWGGGGGLGALWWTPTEPVTDCLFEGNATYQTGGAIWCAESEVTFQRCELYENTVTQYGAGFYCSWTTCVFEDCTLARNYVSVPWGGFGGALAIGYDSSCILRRCTIAENETGHSGSAINVEEQVDLTLESCILAFGDVEALTCPVGTELSINCTNIYGNEGGDWTGVAAVFAGVAGNIGVDPRFCGDATPEAPYSLREGSPCGPGQYPCTQMGAWGIGCDEVIAVGDAHLPAAVRLFDIAPNPFNPQTRISFAVPDRQRVAVAVYRLDGRRVGTLADREYTAGNHVLMWNGRDDHGRALPSGVYLVRLVSDSGVEARKAMLVR